MAGAACWVRSDATRALIIIGVGSISEGKRLHYIAMPSSENKEGANALRTVNVLRNGTSIDRLARTHKLNARHHSDHRIVQLSYSNHADMANRIVQECRGLILERDTWRVVSWPFAKFFNADEPNAAPALGDFDWSSARVYEKCDGSLMTLYHYGKRWHVSSSSLPAANGQLPFQSGKATFADMFWHAWRSADLDLPKDTSKCYMFELMLPQNIIVVRHARPTLTLLGARDLTSLTELDCEEVGAANGWPTPRRFPQLGSLDAVKTAARGLDPTSQEGFVVVDGLFRRLKVKSPAYVALHHMGTGAPRAAKSPSIASEEDERIRRRRLLEVARHLEGDEFLAYFPLLRKPYADAASELRALRSAIERRVKTAAAADGNVVVTNGSRQGSRRGSRLGSVGGSVGGSSGALDTLAAQVARKMATRGTEETKDADELDEVGLRLCTDLVIGEVEIQFIEAALAELSSCHVDGASSPAASPDDASTSALPSTVGAASCMDPEAAVLEGTDGTASPRLPHMVITVGLPGAGKSTFAESLVASGRGWRRVSQDELGSRRAVDAALAELGEESSTHIVLDRCNVTAEDRAQLRRAARLPAGSAVACVFFDVDRDECERRVAARHGHPTIRHGDGRAAVRGMAKALEIPEASEGFDELVSVRNPQQVDELLVRWGAKGQAKPPNANDADLSAGGHGEAAGGEAAGGEAWMGSTVGGERRSEGVSKGRPRRTRGEVCDQVRLTLVDACNGGGPSVLMARAKMSALVEAVATRLRLKPRDAIRLCLTARGEKSPLSPEECQMLRSGATVVASLLPRGQSIEAARCARAAEAARARAAAAAADQSAADKASESGAERRSKACEKKKMPTALSVIHRFQWGAVADAASRVAVGFVDRLAAGGVSERPLAAFECWGEAVCSVGEEALAIPQHRIQYFKFDGEVVWEKATGLDLVSERVNAAAAAAA